MASAKWSDHRFGEAVKRHRERLGWTQVQMAKMLADRGLQPMRDTTLAKIEAGSRSVRINEAIAIADLLELSLDDLVGRPPQNPDSVLGEGLLDLKKALEYHLPTPQRIDRDIVDALDWIHHSGSTFAVVAQELSGYAEPVFRDLKALAAHLRELSSHTARAISEWEQRSGDSGENQ